MQTYKKCTTRQYYISVSESTFSSDNPLKIVKQ